MAKVKAIWTGEYPCLCSGEWKLFVDDVEVTEKIPKELRYSPMNTLKEYYEWHWDEDGIEEWGSYSDGLSEEVWVWENREWLDTITKDPLIQSQIYQEVNAKDWRHGSCGGCS